MDLTEFVRQEVEGVAFYICPAFARVRGLHHGFSTRFGGTGSLNLTHLPWDACERVEENRRRFLSALGFPHCPLVTLRQIHSDRIQIVHDGADELDRGQEGDALATKQAGIALGVQVADCFPILLADVETGSVAAVHSGWRGTLLRILWKTIETMKSSLGAQPGSLRVAIGPGIRSCCMQVGPEVAARYEAEYPGLGLARPQTEIKGKYLLDMAGALAIQAAEAGLHPDQIFDMKACTRCLPEEFFSYRAEGTAAGRMMAVIGRL